MSRYDKLIKSGVKIEFTPARWKSIIDSEMKKIAAGLGMDQSACTPHQIKDSDIEDGFSRVVGCAHALQGPNTIEARYLIKAGQGKDVSVDLIMFLAQDGSYHIEFAGVLRKACSNDDNFYDNILSALVDKKSRT
ncbi:hypothetical protein [Sorangium sp. So ce693]|uniref:hypothetical protein n=1 Tax=Sorangium sp. So ce693 TaxID=3133318 RepID=UPI003F627B5E